MPPDAANVLSRGYPVHMKIPLDSDMRACMEDILRKYVLGLMYKEERDLTIIYRPTKGNQG